MADADDFDVESCARCCGARPRRPRDEGRRPAGPEAGSNARREDEGRAGEGRTLRRAGGGEARRTKGHRERTGREGLSFPPRRPLQRRPQRTAGRPTARSTASGPASRTARSSSSSRTKSEPA